MLQKRTLVNIRAKCPIILVRSASPVGSLSYQVKPRTRRWFPGAPSLSAGVLGCFFVVLVILGFSLSRCGVVWCIIFFIYFFWLIFPGAIQPIRHGNKPLVCPWLCLPVLCQWHVSHVCFPLSFITFPKGSGLFSMFLHLCLHGPLRIWWVHLCWVQRFSTFISIYVYGVFFSCCFCLIIFSNEEEHLPFL